MQEKHGAGTSLAGRQPCPDDAPRLARKGDGLRTKTGWRAADPTARELTVLRCPAGRRAYTGADGAAVANKITIFRGPHERFYPDPRARAAAVESTVFHEVAHHFGISDERLRERQEGR